MCISHTSIIHIYLYTSIHLPSIHIYIYISSSHSPVLGHSQLSLQLVRQLLLRLKAIRQAPCHAPRFAVHLDAEVALGLEKCDLYIYYMYNM